MIEERRRMRPPQRCPTIVKVFRLYQDISIGVKTIANAGNPRQQGTYDYGLQHRAYRSEGAMNVSCTVHPVMESMLTS